MARPLRIEYPNAFYHLISRGNERKVIFQSNEDYELFLECLEEACCRFDVQIHTYCLMPNHIHLLAQTKEANLSQFMKRLLDVYTIRYNRRHKRYGHLFQGRYKSYLIEEDNCLVALSRYIHLNPVKAGIVKHARMYPRSSMSYYLGKRYPCSSGDWGNMKRIATSGTADQSFRKQQPPINSTEAVVQNGKSLH